MQIRGAHDDAIRARVLASRAFKREELPLDPLGALIFLSTADSDFLTGQTLAVDGRSINT